jgi:hypothetical protein
VTRPPVTRPPDPDIDLTDAAQAKAGSAKRRGTAATGEDKPKRAFSGRPPELLEHHRLITITGGDRWMDAEAFVYDMYLSIGYTQPSSKQQVEELARWADQSKFFAVVDPDDEIVGTIRTIYGAYEDLPVSQFERTDFSYPDPLCELSSLVVDNKVRSTGVLEHLFRAGWAETLRSGSSAIVALVDTWLFDAFREAYALPFIQLGQPHFHMGGDVVPVALSTAPEIYEEVAFHNPDFMRWSFEALTDQEMADLRMPILPPLPEEVIDLTVVDEEALASGRTLEESVDLDPTVEDHFPDDHHIDEHHAAGQQVEGRSRRR